MHNCTTLILEKSKVIWEGQGRGGESWPLEGFIHEFFMRAWLEQDQFFNQRYLWSSNLIPNLRSLLGLIIWLNKILKIKNPIAIYVWLEVKDSKSNPFV